MNCYQINNGLILNSYDLTIKYFLKNTLNYFSDEIQIFNQESLQKLPKNSVGLK